LGFILEGGKAGTMQEIRGEEHRRARFEAEGGAFESGGMHLSPSGARV
jgi:hypothetical protein